MGTVTSLADFRQRQDAAREERLASMVSACMNCGAEYPYVERYDHNCQDETGARKRHPSRMR